MLLLSLEEKSVGTGDQEPVVWPILELAIRLIFFKRLSSLSHFRSSCTYSEEADLLARR